MCLKIKSWAYINNCEKNFAQGIRRFYLTKSVETANLFDDDLILKLRGRLKC